MLIIEEKALPHTDDEPELYFNIVDFGEVDADLVDLKCLPVFYLSQGAESWVKLAFAVLAFVYIGATSYLYPIMARYDAPVRNSVLNCFALSSRHLLSTAIVVCLNLMPLAMYFLKTDLFWKTSFLWLLGGFALIAYANGRILLSVFRKYEKTEQTADENY